MNKMQVLGVVVILFGFTAPLWAGWYGSHILEAWDWSGGNSEGVSLAMSMISMLAFIGGLAGGILLITAYTDEPK